MLQQFYTCKSEFFFCSKLNKTNLLEHVMLWWVKFPLTNNGDPLKQVFLYFNMKKSPKNDKKILHTKHHYHSF